MAVYVDDMAAPYGRMTMSHMIADSQEELLKMAFMIGIARKWIQKVGTHREHFDVCKAARTRAVKFGAIEITQRELYYKTLAKKEANGSPQSAQL
jgi:hypothetical protein